MTLSDLMLLLKGMILEFNDDRILDYTFVISGKNEFEKNISKNESQDINENLQTTIENFPDGIKIVVRMMSNAIIQYAKTNKVNEFEGAILRDNINLKKYLLDEVSTIVVLNKRNFIYDTRKDEVFFLGISDTFFGIRLFEENTKIMELINEFDISNEKQLNHLIIIRKENSGDYFLVYEGDLKNGENILLSPFDIVLIKKNTRSLALLGEFLNPNEFIDFDEFTRYYGIKLLTCNEIKEFFVRDGNLRTQMQEGESYRSNDTVIVFCQPYFQ